MRISVRAAGVGFSLILAAVGTAAAIVGSTYGFTGEDGRVGPGFLPVVFGAAVALLALVDVAQRVLRRDRGVTIEDLATDLAAGDEPVAAVVAPEDEPPRNADGEEVDIFGRTQRQRTRILVSVMVGLVAAVLLTSLIGLLLSFTLLMAFVAIVLEKRPVVPSLIISVVAAGGIWLVFRELLSVPLPTGLLGLL